MPRHSVPVTEPQTLDVYTARGPVEGEDWIAVARALNERMAALRLGQQELAQRSGISVSTLRKLQHGAGRRVQNKTLAAISAALDWPADHLAAVLLADHTPPSSPQTVDADPISDRLQRIEEHLRQVTGRLATIEALLRAFTR